jgi:predicted DNA-binding transcriptional regulator AlpA
MLNGKVKTAKQDISNQKPLSEMDLIRLPELSRLTTLKPSTIFKGIKNKTIPQPFKLLGINLWDKQEVLNWISSQRQ